MIMNIGHQRITEEALIMDELQIFTAYVSVPGYLPESEDRPLFASASDAWDWLADERRRDEDYVWEPVGDGGYSDTLAILEQLASPETDYAAPEWSGWVQPDGTGSILAPAVAATWTHPGYLFVVSRVEHSSYPHEAGRLPDCPLCEILCHCGPGVPESQTPCVHCAAIVANDWSDCDVDVCPARSHS